MNLRHSLALAICGGLATALCVTLVTAQEQQTPKKSQPAQTQPAQTQRDTPTTTKDKTKTTTATISDELSSPLAKSSDIVGMAVVNKENKSLGKINNLVINLETGKIEYAVVSHGGLLGAGATLVGVPMDALMIVREPGEETAQFRLDVTEEQFKNAPAMKGERWPAVVQTEWLGESYKAAFRPGKTTTEQQQQLNQNRNPQQQNQNKRKPNEQQPQLKD